MTAEGYKFTDEQGKHMSESYKGLGPWNKGLSKNSPGRYGESIRKYSKANMGITIKDKFIKCYGLEEGLKRHKLWKINAKKGFLYAQKLAT